MESTRWDDAQGRKGGKELAWKHTWAGTPSIASSCAYTASGRFRGIGSRWVFFLYDFVIVSEYFVT